MPYAPPVACPYPGCWQPNCVEHTRKRWSNAAHRERGGSAAQRGYGAAWRKLRAVVLREEPLCRTCMEQGLVSAASDVDHVVPKSEGGTDERSNLQPQCKACHRAKDSVLAAHRGRLLRT